MADGYASTSILIVDDNPAAGKTLQLVLKTEGYEADWASGAAEAMQMAGEKSYEAALIDIGLPGRSGIDVLADLKARRPDLVAIIVTGQASTESSIEALNRGASGYVRKPVDVQQLFGLLRAALEKKRLEEENWRMLRRLSLLHAIGAKVSVGLEPQTTLRDTIGLVVTLLDLTGGAIWWYATNGERPAVAASVGLPDALVRRLTDDAADLRARLAADPDLRNRPWFDVPETVGEDNSPWRVRLMPLGGHETLIGCMAIGGPEWLGGETEEAEALGAVAAQVGVAMENMRLYEDLRLALERLKEAQARVVQVEKLSALGRVASGVAHELNNPLTAILVYADLLREGVDEAQTPGIAERIHNQTERCAKIIQSLLSFARQERTVLRPTDLRQVIDAALDSTERARADWVKLVLDLPDAFPTLAGDPGGLQQVLTNIISNACHAMGEAGGVLTVAGKVAEDTVTLRISDTGPGIPDDVLPRIFDPFFTTKGVGQGTGLGLSVSHGIVNDHGGEITADNAPEGGAAFTIRLPIREVETSADTAVGEAVQDAPWLQPTGGE